jgi:hypothetical protein
VDILSLSQKLNESTVRQSLARQQHPANRHTRLFFLYIGSYPAFPRRHTLYIYSNMKSLFLVSLLSSVCVFTAATDAPEQEQRRQLIGRPIDAIKEATRLQQVRLMRQQNGASQPTQKQPRRLKQTASTRRRRLPGMFWFRACTNRDREKESLLIL